MKMFGGIPSLVSRISEPPKDKFVSPRLRSTRLGEDAEQISDPVPRPRAMADGKDYWAT